MADTQSSTGAGKPVVTEKPLVGLGGWLAFHTVAVGASAVGHLWAFFLAIIAMIEGAEGVDLAVAIEMLIFSLGLVFLCGWTLFLFINRKKLATLWAYITLGVTALCTTIMLITIMFHSIEECSYGYGYYVQHSCQSVGLPASSIIALVGMIFVTWATTLLIAYYFKKSQRVKLTFTK
ncbi:hypothetical protein FWH58_03515 [Candidatus Saccharibacteria bacterium]|nr:hypothetical protein [Candidatus Saccharibacteria bacterium]